MNLIPNSPLKEFLTEKSGTAINTVTDLQDVLQKYYLAISEFRTFLKDNENTEMELHLNLSTFEQEIKKELYNSCKSSDVDGVFTIKCDASLAATKKINIADMIALRQLTAGELLFGILYNSYSLEGLDKLGAANSNGAMSSEEKTKFIFSQSEFGKLRKDNQFNLLSAIGSDLGAAVSWAVKYQDNLCHNKEINSEDQRKGYLFKKGFCIKDLDEVNKKLLILQSALHGVIQIDNEDKNKKLNVDLFVWSRSPILDLRQVEPQGFNKCGGVTNFKDNTLGGLFVNNDADQFFKSCNN